MLSLFCSFGLLVLFLTQQEVAVNVTTTPANTTPIPKSTFYTQPPTYEPTKDPTPKPTSPPTVKPTRAPTIALNSSAGINILCYVSMAGLGATDVESQESFFILAFKGAANIEASNFTRTTTTIDNVVNSTCSPTLDGITIKFDIVTFDSLALNEIKESFHNGEFQSTFQSSVSFVFSDATICMNATNYTYQIESSNVLITPMTTESIGQKITDKIQFLIFGIILMIISLLWLSMSRIPNKQHVATYFMVNASSTKIYTYNVIGILAASTRKK